ncbi:MAG: hypothetical protein HKN76_14885, partial [Saprospiraceae bacterium]|nr:hypothetical protein [Saprospiraceae bacterium]
AIRIKDVLPKDACIIIPPNVTGIRYFSQRSIYVDYKSNIHSKKYLSQADVRRKELYNMTLDARRSGKDLVTEGAIYYSNMDTSGFQKLKKDGATHVLTKVGHKLYLPEVIRNNEYIVYKL